MTFLKEYLLLVSIFGGLFVLFLGGLSFQIKYKYDSSWKEAVFWSFLLFSSFSPMVFIDVDTFIERLALGMFVGGLFFLMLKERERYFNADSD